MGKVQWGRGHGVAWNGPKWAQGQAMTERSLFPPQELVAHCRNEGSQKAQRDADKAQASSQALSRDWPEAVSIAHLPVDPKHVIEDLVELLCVEEQRRSLPAGSTPESQVRVPASFLPFWISTPHLPTPHFAMTSRTMGAAGISNLLESRAP